MDKANGDGCHWKRLNYSQPPACLRQSRVHLSWWTIWNLVDKLGWIAYNTAWDTNTDGTFRVTKPVQTRKRLRLLSKTKFEGQYIYKYSSLDKETIRKNKSTGLLRYVLQELPKRIIASIERAIVIGDGLVDARRQDQAVCIRQLTPRLANVFKQNIRQNQRKSRRKLS